MAPKSGSVSSDVDSGMTLSRSDREATLDGAKLAIAGVKAAMKVVANARVGSKNSVPNEISVKAYGKWDVVIHLYLLCLEVFSRQAGGDWRHELGSSAFIFQ